MMASASQVDPQALAWSATSIADLRVCVFNDPLERQVRTSFGVMSRRPGLLVRLTDADGTHGYGEVWCNFPDGGARYKATLLGQYARPALLHVPVQRPEQVMQRLQALFAVLRLQCADHGAIEQLMAGVDQAAWDLFCKRAGQPFWKLQGGAPQVPVYASGIGPEQVADTIHAEAAAGHTRFKIKLGFGDAVDERNLDLARAALPPGGALMVDVNQGWSSAQARHWLPRLARAGVLWCEEPLRADTPWSEWDALAQVAPQVRIAAGENLLGADAFLAATQRGGIRVLQPDVGKWGGISGALDLARRAELADAWICPHWLAGAVGLMASLQLKSAMGGQGWVEVDTNSNRQRSDVFPSSWKVRAGAITLPDEPGLIPPLAHWIDDPRHWHADAQELAYVD